VLLFIVVVLLWMYAKVFLYQRDSSWHLHRYAKYDAYLHLDGVLNKCYYYVLYIYIIKYVNITEQHELISYLYYTFD